jgi:hypothetical protein
VFVVLCFLTVCRAGRGVEEGGARGVEEGVRVCRAADCLPDMHSAQHDPLPSMPASCPALPAEPPEIVEPTAIAALNINWPGEKLTVRCGCSGRRDSRRRGCSSRRQARRVGSWFACWPALPAQHAGSSAG